MTQGVFASRSRGVRIGIADRLVHGLGQPAELADVEIDPAQGIVLLLARDQHDLGLDDAGVADHAAAGLDDGLGDAVAEVLAQRRGDRPPIGLHHRNLLQVLGREAAAEIDHAQADAALGQRAEDRGRGGERTVPGVRVGLLRADMEGDAIGVQAPGDGRARARRRPSPGRSRTCATAAIRRRRWRSGCGRRRGPTARRGRSSRPPRANRRRRGGCRARRRRRCRAPS